MSELGFQGFRCKDLGYYLIITIFIGVKNHFTGEGKVQTRDKEKNRTWWQKRDDSVKEQED